MKNDFIVLPRKEQREKKNFPYRSISMVLTKQINTSASTCQTFHVGLICYVK